MTVEQSRPGKSMPLILRDNRFDFRDFPDLMPQWVGIIPGHACPTPSTHSGFYTHHLMTLVRRDQRPFVLGMAGLSSLFLIALFPPGYWLRMRVFGARRRRRIAGSFLDRRNFRLHQRDPGQQNPKDGLSRRRLLRDDFLGDQNFMRHEKHVVDFAQCAMANFTSRRSRGVNCYRLWSPKLPQNFAPRHLLFTELRTAQTIVAQFIGKQFCKLRSTVVVDVDIICEHMIRDSINEVPDFGRYISKVSQ